MRGSAAVLVALCASGLAAQTVRVPFVGCEAVGQADLRKAPKGNDKAIKADANAGSKLAYYEQEFSPGVLAPLGWHCLGLYGSSGADLFIGPQRISRSISIGEMMGPSVELSDVSGETGSGRFRMAQIVARVFPKQRAFVRHEISSFDFPASEFKFTPFPKDQMIPRGDRVIEYQTPPHSEGLGTMGRLRAGDQPIDGVAIFVAPAPGRSPELFILRVRLPREQRDLAPVIIHDLLVREGGDAR